MNVIFFLLPFVAVVGLGTFQAFAEVGYDYSIIDNQDGTKTWSSHHPYIFDGTNYVPFIKSNNQVQTATDTVILNSDGSYSWVERGITDKIIAKYADASDLTSWIYLTSLNNVTPTNTWNGQTFTSSKANSIGILEYKYTLNGLQWKTELEATNLTALTTKIFGFDEIIDLNTDTIMFGGQQRNLDNFNGQTFYKPWLDANKGKVLDFLNGIAFDFDKGYDNLYSITVIDTGANKSRLVFDYRMSSPLLPGEKLSIDPTFGPSVGVSDGLSMYSTGVCSTYAGDAVVETAVGSAGTTCLVKYIYWNTSALPDNLTVTNSSLKLNVSNNVNSATIEVVAVKNNPKLVSNSTNWTNIITNSTVYTNFVGTLGIKDLDLGTTGDSHIQGLTVNDWFAVGLRKNPQSIENKYAGISNTESFLTVTYHELPLPDAITTLTLDGGDSTTIDMSWVAPNFNGEPLVNYMVKYTTPFGNATLFLGNTTDTYFNATSLTQKTPYSFQVSAFTNGGANWTGNILNVYTAGKPSAVTDLIATATSFSTIELGWSLPDLFNGTLAGYQINYTTPLGDPNIIITNNTGTSDTNYEIFGLSETSGYSFRVGVWNQYGLNATGNIANGTTTANFIIGDINIPTESNPDVVDVYFTRVNNNATQSTVTVRYPNTATDFKCDLGYQFARTNQTYSGMTPTVYDDDFDTVSFQFNGVENEIINFNCYDEDNTLINGRYVVTQSNFPLLDQINNFRNGTYGTMGMFGVIDFITLAVIIFSMIGFNRVNDAVGVIFNVMLIGALAYFQVITVPTIIFGAIAVVLMFAITSTRKD